MYLSADQTKNNYTAEQMAGYTNFCNTQGIPLSEYIEFIGQRQADSEKGKFSLEEARKMTMDQIVNGALCAQQERIFRMSMKYPDFKSELKVVHDACAALSEDTCNICRMWGHKDGQCWLNQALYDKCRKDYSA